VSRHFSTGCRKHVAATFDECVDYLARLPKPEMSMKVDEAS
jgi:hypothetical protein